METPTICPLCRTPVTNPMIGPCKNLFCRDCLNSWFKYNLSSSPASGRAGNVNASGYARDSNDLVGEMKQLHEQQEKILNDYYTTLEDFNRQGTVSGGHIILPVDQVRELARRLEEKRSEFKELNARMSADFLLLQHQKTTEGLPLQEINQDSILNSSKRKIFEKMNSMEHLQQTVATTVPGDINPVQMSNEEKDRIIANLVEFQKMYARPESIVVVRKETSEMDCRIM